MESDESTFGYRGHVSWGQWLVLAYFGLMAVGSGGLTLSRWLLHGHFSFAGVLFSLFFFGLTGGFFALYRALATSEVALREEGLAYANYKGEGFVDYDDLEAVRGRFIPYIGGWLTLVGPDVTLRMTVVLDDIDEFTRQLYDRLEPLESPPFDRDNLFGFYKTAAYSNLSWDHFYDSWPLILAGNVATIAVSSATFALAGAPGEVIVSAALLLGVVLPWLLLPIFDLFGLARRIARESELSRFEIPRISDAERTEHLRRIGILILGFVLVADLGVLLLYSCCLG